MLAFHTDADLPTAHDARDPTRLLDRARITPGLAELLAAARFATPTIGGLAPAHGTILAPFAGPGWAAVGDAALGFDPLAIASLACVLLAVELQVRLVEDPYLLRTHGQRYRDLCGSGRALRAGARADQGVSACCHSRIVARRIRSGGCSTVRRAPRGPVAHGGTQPDSSASRIASPPSGAVSISCGAPVTKAMSTSTIASASARCSAIASGA